MKNLFLSLLVLSSGYVSAAEKCSFKDSNELFELIKKNHPTIEMNNSNKKTIELATDKASQRANPELDSEMTTVDTAEGKVFNTSISLKHVFELGGKRDSRIAVAHSYIKSNLQRARFQNENALIDTVLKIQRLTQIYQLIPIYKEAGTTINMISKRMNKRKSLSPQEEVEKETLELAASDYKLQLSQLYSERMYLKRHLTLFAGIDCELEKKNFKNKLNFKMSIDETVSTANYSKLQIAKSNLELAKSKLSNQESLSYSDMSLGPIYEYEKNPTRTNHKIGLALTVDLPLLSTNDAGKAMATNNISTASILFNNARKDSELDLEAWKNQYKRYRRSLRSVAKQDELEKKHQKIEKLFSRGIISTSLVIESHRQLLDFTKTRLEFETGTVQALWSIYELSGNLSNQKL